MSREHAPKQALASDQVQELFEQAIVSMSAVVSDVDIAAALAALLDILKRRAASGNPIPGLRGAGLEQAITLSHAIIAKAALEGAEGELP